MRILLDNSHTPYNEYLCAALPEFEFIVPGWNAIRDIPKNVTVGPDPSDYDALITDDRSRPSESPRRRSILIQHNACCLPGDYPFYSHAIDSFDYLVSVSGGKACTLKDLAFRPNVRVIEFGFPDYIRRTKPWINGRVGVAWIGLNANQSYDNFLKLVDGLDAVVISPTGEFPPSIKHLKPIGSHDFFQALETLNVFVYPMEGEQCGLAPMEAMMMGTPVVTGSVPELHRGVYREFNCFMSRASCSQSIPWLRSKIELLIENQDFAMKTGIMGRYACRKFWSLEAHRQSWLEVLL